MGPGRSLARIQHVAPNSRLSSPFDPFEYCPLAYVELAREIDRSLALEVSADDSADYLVGNRDTAYPANGRNLESFLPFEWLPDLFHAPLCTIGVVIATRRER